MGNSKTEILAPAGSMETLVAALRTGADAVYVGGKNFSARSNASNFTLEELAEAAEKCHLYQAKIYLAVNTIISDEETTEFCEYIKAAAALGIDAYIVQDWGCAMLIRKCLPDAVLHASTQMTVHTSYGAELLKELGFSRVVPARELDKNTLKKICDTGIQTEVFVHGALCMSVSGQCYMSAVIGSRSANRGCCGQACRLPFSASGNETYSALSLKDLSLIPNISELEEIGASSLKIEGRMKRPEYVAASVNAIVDKLNNGQPDMQMLRGIFSRSGFTDGYFTGKLMDMFGVREKQDVISAQSLIPKIHEMYRGERKVQTIDFHVEIKNNQPVVITASCNSLSVSVSSDIPDIAEKRPTDLAMLEKQLSRLGDTVFSLGKVTAEIDDGLIVPAGKINELRRSVAEKMSNLIISSNHPQNAVTDYLPCKKPEVSEQCSKIGLRTICKTTEQAMTAINYSQFIIVSADILNGGSLDKLDKDKIIVLPPRFITNEDETFQKLQIAYDRGFRHLLCHTPDCIAMGLKIGFTLHGGFGLNVYNSFSAEYLSELGLVDLIFSFESKVSQINEAVSSIPVGAVLYGRLPLMLTRNCPIKNEVGCAECKGYLIDRTGRSLPVNCCKEYVEILNCDTLYMFDKISQFTSINFGVIILNGENAAQTEAVLKGIRPEEKITRGLYYRGI